MYAPRWIAITVATALLPVVIPSPVSRAETSVDDQTIIVTFSKDQSDPTASAEAAIKKAGGVVRNSRAITRDTVAITVAADSAKQATQIGELAENQSGVQAAETSRQVYPTVTNDTYHSYLWGLNSAGGASGINAEGAWPYSTGKGAVIGVVDTGIAPHSDLSPNIIPGYDFVSDSANAADGNGWDSNPNDEGSVLSTPWHGTHVAGTAAAVGNNKKGVVGVAPQASLLPLRVLGRSGGTEIDLIAAIRWGAGLAVSGVKTNAKPASVLNLSLGGSGQCSTALQSAITDATAAGTAVVVSTGNDSKSLSGTYPANCSNVIRVVASTYEGRLASYSNYGSSAVPATIAAPGGSGENTSDGTDWIFSTWRSNGAESYVGMMGTSMAAPHVSGVIALLKAADPSLSVKEVTSLLTRTAKPLSKACSTSVCGAGIVNAPAAVTAAGGASTAAASARIGAPTISGKPAVGKRLTAAANVSPSNAHLTWHWLRNGATISGATGSSYVPTSSDFGRSITVRGSVTYGMSAAKSTSASKKISAGSFAKSSSPTAIGTYQVGKQLKATAGSWVPRATTVKYQWLRNGKAIKKASKSTYKLTKADRKKKISVKVTVKRHAYETATAVSFARKVK